MSHSLGSTGFSAEIATGSQDSKLEWTLHWTEQNAWLGYNVEVQVDGSDIIGNGKKPGEIA
jgi:hypothetical protein